MDQDLNITPEPEVKKPIFKKILIGIGVVFVLVALFFAVRIILTPSSEEVLANAFIKMEGIESFSYNANGVITINTDEESGGLSYHFNGTDDLVLQKSKGSFRFDVFWEGIAMMLDGEFAVNLNKEEIVYIKFDTLPSLPFMDISVLRNEWIEIKSDDSDENKIDNEKLMNEISALIIEGNVIKTKEEMPVIEINDVPVYRLRAYLDRENFKKIIPDIINLINESQGNDPYILSDEEYQEINKVIDRIGEIEFDVYIGKRDGFIHRITFTREFGAENIFDINSDEAKEYFMMYPEMEKVRVSLNFEINYSDFNKDSVIEMPTDFINIEDLGNLFAPVEIFPESDYNETYLEF